MKFIALAFAIILIYFTPSAAQTELKVIDAQSNKNISHPSIVFLKENFAGNGEANGTVLIPKQIDRNDTLVVYAQGYLPYKQKVSEVLLLPAIELTRRSIESEAPERINLKSLKEKAVLNEFDSKKVFYFTGLEKPLEQFTYLQIAQKFTLPKEGGIISDVLIRRLILKDELDDELYKVTQTKFKLRFYDIDPVTSGPGKELYNEEVWVTNKTSEEIKVKLSNHKIQIPGKSFYVAIEWVRILHNAQAAAANKDGTIDLNYRPEIDRLKLMYQPFIGMSNRKGAEINAWVLNFRNEWKKYEYFSPRLTDFAISTTVKF